MGKQWTQKYFWPLSPAQEEGRTVSSTSWSGGRIVFTHPSFIPPNIYRSPNIYRNTYRVPGITLGVGDSDMIEHKSALKKL